MRGMGAGMRRARPGRERREWRCHPHVGEETRPEKGAGLRGGGAGPGRRSRAATGPGAAETPGDPAAPPAPRALTRV